MLSLNTKVKRIATLVDTPDLSEWANSFVKNIDERTSSGADVSQLTEKQIDVIDRIFAQHFGD